MNRGEGTRSMNMLSKDVTHILYIMYNINTLNRGSIFSNDLKFFKLFKLLTIYWYRNPVGEDISPILCDTTLYTRYHGNIGPWYYQLWEF